MKKSRRNAAIRRRFMTLVRRGTTGRELVVTILAGVFLAVFPVYGITAIFCAWVAYRYHLNQLIIQVVNFLALPLQLLLFVPFVRLGEWIFRSEGMEPHSLAQLKETLAAHPLNVFRYFVDVFGVAIVGWALTVLPLLLLLLGWSRSRWGIHTGK